MRSDSPTAREPFWGRTGRCSLRRALARRTPAEAFTARPHANPDRQPRRHHHRVRHDIVDEADVITLRHNSQLHHIGIGQLHTGTRVIMLVADLHIRVIAQDTGELLRELTLDPTRDYQPRGVKPGPQPAQKCDDVPRQV